MSTSKEKIVSVGIDVSKDELVVSIILYSLMSQTFRQLTRFTEDNTPAGIRKVIKKIRSHASQNGHCSVRVTMEATGVYYEELALGLFDRHEEYHLSVMLPSKAKKLIEGMGNRSKTDRVDADALAR
jgi:transposase